VAALPDKVIAGREWELLQREVAARLSGATIDHGLPQGFAAGYVEYEGEFRFGFYEDTLIFRHADQSWHATVTCAATFVNHAPNRQSSAF
jgi:hypothetical protein